MTQSNAIQASVAELKAAPVTITYREIQEIVRKNNLAEGKSSQNYHPRPRRGKTRNERVRGESKRREENKDLRGAWSNGGEKTFPLHTCNGHRYYRGTQVKTRPTMNGKNVRSA